MKTKIFTFIALCFVLIGNVNAQQTGYQKSLEIGGQVALDKLTSGSFDFAMINGYRFNQTISLGIGVGFRYTNALYYEESNYTSMDGKYLIPIFGQIKANLSKSKISPYLLGNVGYTIDVSANANRNTEGLMIEPAFGVDFNLNDKQSIYVQIGYNLQSTKYTYFAKTYDEEITGMAESISLRVGFKF